MAKGCLGYNTYDGDFDCEYENAPICEDCIYGPYMGKIDPELGYCDEEEEDQ